MTSAAGGARRIGLWIAISLVMGNMIGSGVYLLPTSLAPLGWNAVFGWVLTVGGALCVALVLARLAAQIPAGGPIGFVRSAFGPFPAFLVGWSYWISIWVANAALAIAAVSYLSVFAPGIAKVPGLPAALAVGLLWLVTLLNTRGAAVAGGFQIVTLLLKVLPLVAVVVIVALLLVGGIGAAHVTEFRPGAISASAINAGAALTLWAMLGFESAVVPQDKVENPQVTVPRATVVGTALVGLIYLLTCSAVILLLPAGLVARSDAPFADFIEAYWGHGPALFVALFAAVSAIGALNGWVLLQGELPLSMARAGNFPAWFGRTDRRDTPVRALVLSSLLASLVALMNYTRSMAELFVFMALLATAAALVLYLSCALAGLRLAQTRRVAAHRGFLLLAAIGVVYAIWTLFGAGGEAVGWGAVLLAAGIPVFFLMRRSRPAQEPAE